MESTFDELLHADLISANVSYHYYFALAELPVSLSWVQRYHQIWAIDEMLWWINPVPLSFTWAILCGRYLSQQEEGMNHHTPLFLIAFPIGQCVQNLIGCRGDLGEVVWSGEKGYQCDTFKQGQAGLPEYDSGFTGQNLRQINATGVPAAVRVVILPWCIYRQLERFQYSSCGSGVLGCGMDAAVLLKAAPLADTEVIDEDYIASGCPS